MSHLSSGRPFVCVCPCWSFCLSGWPILCQQPVKMSHLSSGGPIVRVCVYVCPYNLVLVGPFASQDDPSFVSSLSWCLIFRQVDHFVCVCCVCTLIICNNKLKSVTHAIITMLYFSLNRCHSSSNWLILGKQHGKNDCMYMYACRPILLCVIIHFLTHTGSCGDHISNNYVSVSVGTAHIKMVGGSRVTTKITLVHFIFHRANMQVRNFLKSILSW